MTEHGSRRAVEETIALLSSASGTREATYLYRMKQTGLKDGGGN